MAKKRIKRNDRYFNTYDGGGLIGKFANWNEAATNKFMGSGVGGALGKLGVSGSNVGGIASTVASTVSGLINPSGNSTGVGNVLQGIGSVASNIPGIGGVIGAGVNLVGGLVNAAFGSKLNKEFIAQTEDKTKQQAGYTSSANDNVSLLSDWASYTDMAHVNKNQVGSDGWFSNKAKNKAKSLNSAIDEANLRAWHSLSNTASNVDTNNDFLAMANFSAYGGPIFSTGAIGYDLASRDLNNKQMKALGDMRLTSLPNSFNAMPDVSTINTFSKGGGIHIKKKNRGKFTDYCGGNVTSECIQRGLHSSNPTTRKRANFARNARKWHGDGGPIKTGKSYITLDTYYPIISSYPYTGHSELSITDKDSEGRLKSYNIDKSGKNEGYNLFTNNCSDATRCALEETFGKKLNPFLFTTPGDVQDFSLKELGGIPEIKGDSIFSDLEGKYILDRRPKNIKKGRSGVSTVYIPVNQDQKEFLKNYIRTGNSKNEFSIGGYLDKLSTIRDNKKAFGGELNTQGGNFTNGVTFIDNGGSHEANPFEGVQMGIDPQGVPNLVEEGEVIFNDYVFSDRMKLPKKLKERYSIKGETFADAAKELSKESEERPNDPISQRGLEAFMSALAESQEEVRIKNEDRRMNRYAKGGKLGNLFDGTGNRANRLNPYSNFVPLTDDSFYTPEYMDFWNWYNTNQNTPEGQAWLRRINSGEFGPIGGNTFVPQDIIRLSHDYKKGPVHNAFAAAAKQYNVENPKEAPYTPYTKRWIREKGADGEWRTQQITDEEWNSAPAGRTYLTRKPNLKEGNTITSERGDKDIYYDVIPEELPEELTGDVTEVRGIRQNPLRYAPIIGSGIAVLNDIFGGNDPDYSNADMFASAIRGANRPVGTRPIGEYLAYKPLDRMFYINQLNKNAAAGRRAVHNTSGGNRAAALAGILATDYNYGENLGQMARQAEEYNQALKERVTGFNRQTNMFNSEQGTKVDMFNSELLGKQASLYGQLANMRQRILEGNRAEKSANLTNFIQGLGDLGRELTDRDTLRWLADIGALPYNTRGQYTGGNNTAAPKRSKGGKIKRNKRKGYTI